jgi:hypothetical protein
MAPMIILITRITAHNWTCALLIWGIRSKEGHSSFLMFLVVPKKTLLEIFSAQYSRARSVACASPGIGNTLLENSVICFAMT